MISITKFDPQTGRIAYSCVVPSYSVDLGDPSVVEGSFDEGTFYIGDGKIPTAKGTQPNQFYSFDYTTKQWLDARTLEQCKSDKWDEIKQIRDSLISADLETQYGVFDADAASSVKITQAVLLAVTMMQMQQVGSIDFTLADNSVASLTYPHMIEVGMALATREQSARSVATQIRAQIEASESAAEISNITWSL